MRILSLFIIIMIFIGCSRESGLHPQKREKKAQTSAQTAGDLKIKDFEGMELEEKIKLAEASIKTALENAEPSVFQSISRLSSEKKITPEGSDVECVFKEPSKLYQVAKLNKNDDDSELFVQKSTMLGGLAEDQLKQEECTKLEGTEIEKSEIDPNSPINVKLEREALANILEQLTSNDKEYCASDETPCSEMGVMDVKQIEISGLVLFRFHLGFQYDEDEYGEGWITLNPYSPWLLRVLSKMEDVQDRILIQNQANLDEDQQVETEPEK